MKKNKALKVLSTAALAATLIAPVAAPVSAASTYSVSTVKSVSTGAVNGDVTRISVEIPAGALTTDSTIRLRLPADATAKVAFDVPTSADGTAGGSNQVSAVKATPIVNGVAGTTVTAVNTATTAANEFKIEVTKSGAAARGLFYLDIKDANIPSGTTGAFNATIESQDGLLSNGQVTIATVGNGSVATTVDDVRTIQNKNNQPIDVIRIKEDRPGALKQGKFVVKLPKGFTWNTAGSVSKVWGDAAATTPTVAVGSDKRELEVTVPTTAVTSGQAGYYTIAGATVNVDDSIAKAGEVVAEIKGDSSASNGTVLIANYGDYGATATAADAPVAIAGKAAEEIGKFTIAEQTPNSLISGRKVTLTLSGNAKWATLPRLNDSLSDKQNVTVNNMKIKENDPSVVEFEVGNVAGAKKPAKLVFEKGEVDTAAGATAQDVKLTIGGTAGVSGEVTVAKLQPAVTVKADGELAKAVIGAQDQAIGDFVITETQKATIKGPNKTLTLKFPDGVTPTLPSKVEVIEGDLVLDTANISKSGQFIYIPVKYDGRTPSKIKVSGVKVNVNRTVSEGDLKVDIQGDAVVETNAALTRSYATGTVIPFNNNNTSASGVVAQVVTPASKDTTAKNIVFKLNSKTFTVDGKEVTMDAAPLVAWDRAFLPVRFAANALNVSDDNIVWDEKTSTATIFKGDRVIVAKVGDKFLTVNGAKVPMDVPVYRSAATNNRVMIPVRFLSNALGADIQWNKETNEITIGVK